MGSDMVRRQFLQVAGCGLVLAGQPQAQTTVPNSAGTEAPKLKAPAQACDCPIHVYDPPQCDGIYRRAVICCVVTGCDNHHACGSDPLLKQSVLRNGRIRVGNSWTRHQWKPALVPQRAKGTLDPRPKKNAGVPPYGGKPA